MAENSHQHDANASDSTHAELEALARRSLPLEVVRLSEAAAAAAARYIGRGDEQAPDEAAGRAMHAILRDLPIDGRIVVGEGEEGAVKRLYVNERVGTGKGPHLEVALDPLEGENITAKGGTHALSVVAMAESGGFLHVPDIYMDKIAVGAGLPEGVIDLDAAPEDNLRNVAEARGVPVEDLMVCILDRPRHEDLIGRVLEAGARVTLISDGDVSSIIAAALPGSGVDMYMGLGGAPQGVLAAAALACMGGQMQGRLVVRSESDRTAARRAGIDDFHRKYDLAEMASGNIVLAATGVTDGNVLRGVKARRGGAVTHSLLVSSQTGAVRFVETHHRIASPQLGA